MKKLIIPIALLFALSNCKKKSDDVTPASTTTTPSKSVPTTDAEKKTLITAHTWKIQVATITGFQDVTPSCDTDNTIVFKTNGDYVEDEGATKCSASDDQTTTDKWQLISPNKIILGTGTSADTMNIVNLTDGNFEVDEKSPFGGTTIESHFIFVK